LLGVGGLVFGLAKTKLAWVGRGLLSILMIYQFFTGWMQNPDRLNDYSGAARFLIDRKDADRVLVDATRDGQFVFDVRRLQGIEGKILPLRGSKLLYSRAARNQWGYVQHVSGESDILRLIREYGIRYIVVESVPPNVPDAMDYFPPPCQWLRKLLRDHKFFEKMQSYSISSDPVWRDVELVVYRYRGQFGLVKDTLKLPMPSVGQDVEIKLPGRR